MRNRLRLNLRQGLELGLLQRPFQVVANRKILEFHLAEEALRVERLFHLRRRGAGLNLLLLGRLLGGLLRRFNFRLLGRLGSIRCLALLLLASLLAIVRSRSNSGGNNRCGLLLLSSFPLLLIGRLLLDLLLRLRYLAVVVLGLIVVVAALAGRGLRGPLHLELGLAVHTLLCPLVSPPRLVDEVERRLLLALSCHTWQLAQLMSRKVSRRSAPLPGKRSKA
mmetsp:Transcript_16450/g.41403  ORF Transcript_16450/g.41403 Transcript_16450/m.41403 type:complete len:222 (-) Transcript_16450:2-667(-)